MCCRSVGAKVGGGGLDRVQEEGKQEQRRKKVGGGSERSQGKADLSMVFKTCSLPFKNSNQIAPPSCPAPRIVSVKL